MKIKCWGARGSIAVSGKEFLKYGGDTTCIEINSKSGDNVIIDAGTGIRGLGDFLMLKGKVSSNILFTHWHWDHVLGFPFYKPLYNPDAQVSVFAPSFEGRSAKEIIAGLFTSPYFPMAFENIAAELTFHTLNTEPFWIGSLHITPIALSHPNGGVGYKFTEQGRSFVFLTDNELAFKHPGGLNFQEYVAFCDKVDLLLHDGEYSEEDYQKVKGWGHSTYFDALNLALRSEVKKLGIVHHNQGRSDDELDEILDDCKNTIAKQNSALDLYMMRKGMVLTMDEDGITLDAPCSGIEKESNEIRALRQSKKALEKTLQRFGVEKSNEMQKVLTESAQELAQLKSTITVLREELEKMETKKIRSAQEIKSSYNSEISQLKETIEVQREKMTENMISYEEKLQINRQNMFSEITQLKETILVIRKKIEQTDGK